MPRALPAAAEEQVAQASEAGWSGFHLWALGSVGNSDTSCSALTLRLARNPLPKFSAKMFKAPNALSIGP